MRLLPSLLVCLAGCSSTAARPAPPPPAPEPPPIEVEAMPELVRGLLTDRMKRHASDFLTLYKAVGADDLPATQAAARRIVDEPRLARPTANDQLNAQIPPAFFPFQDDLLRRADALAAAAGSGRRAATKEAFESLSSACRNCHRVFFPAP